MFPTIARLTLIGLKFFLPVLLLFWPFQVSWANYFLDVIDGDVLLQLGLSDSLYQTLDKSADYVTYIFMLLVGRKWKISKLIILLFLYRTVGQILFFTTRNELSFFYFQNFLEPLFMIYSLLIFKFKSESLAHQSYIRHLKLIWLIIFSYKLWNEWSLHYANIDLSQYFLGFTGGQL